MTKKPYKEDIESDGKDDEEIANETWNYYLSREDSAIHDLFTGMFKSTVECMKCHKVSNIGRSSSLFKFEGS